MAEFNVTATDLRHQFSHWVNRVNLAGDRVLVVRHGRLLAALVSPAELNKLDGQQDAATPDEFLVLLKESVKAKNYCAGCSGFIHRPPAAEARSGSGDAEV